MRFLTYTFTDGTGRVGSVPLTRLTPNVSCAQAASTGASGDFGFSGNWYDKTWSGQGFVVELNPVAKALFVTWYTYAVNGQSLGAADSAGTPASPRTTRRVRETTGGLFNQSPPAPATAQVGSGTLTFANCDAAIPVHVGIERGTSRRHSLDSRRAHAGELRFLMGDVNSRASRRPPAGRVSICCQPVDRRRLPS